MPILDIKYELDDLSIVPVHASSINSRTECNPMEDKYYRVFTAPMDTVVGKDSYDTYEQYGIHAIVPRDDDYFGRLEQYELGRNVAFNLTEFKDLYEQNRIKQSSDETYPIVVVDMAQGHMNALLLAVREFRKVYQKVPIMVGNIGNPAIIKELQLLGVNYVRLGIGGGSCCTTSPTTGIHYPLASLIEECVNVRLNTLANCYDQRFVPKPIKLVADGGIHGFDNICKCYALGADYVMLGRELAQTTAHESEFVLEARPFIVDCDGRMHWDKTKYSMTEALENNYKPVRIMHGMASSKGAEHLGKECKFEEGLNAVNVPIIYSLPDWTEKYAAALKSAMAYGGVKTIEEYIAYNIYLVPHLTRGYN